MNNGLQESTEFLKEKGRLGGMDVALEKLDLICVHPVSADFLNSDCHKGGFAARQHLTF